MFNEKGQSLIELIVSLTIAILVLGSLTFAILTSLRNAQFAKNQTQATKLAQEGLEKVRSLRDRDEDRTVTFSYISNPSDPSSTATTNKFSDLWKLSESAASRQYFSCSDFNCYFRFNASVLEGGTASRFEIISGFERQIQIEDKLNDFEVLDGSVQKKITSIVKWEDVSGEHESRLTTILRRIDQ